MMETDLRAIAVARIGRRVAEINDGGRRLSPLNLHVRLNDIRQIASINGLRALEELARCSAQLALLPGHRVAVRTCLEHVDDAIASSSDSDCTAILAALALRLH